MLAKLSKQFASNQIMLYPQNVSFENRQSSEFNQSCKQSDHDLSTTVSFENRQASEFNQSMT